MCIKACPQISIMSLPEHIQQKKDYYLLSCVPSQISFTIPLFPYSTKICLPVI